MLRVGITSALTREAKLLRGGITCMEVLQTEDCEGIQTCVEVLQQLLLGFNIIFLRYVNIHGFLFIIPAMRVHI